MKMIMHSFVAALSLFIAVPAWAADTAQGPKEVIESTVNQIINVLDKRADKTRLNEDDRNNIRKAVEGRFDYEAMAKRSLGKPWNDLNAKEQAHFTEVFRELLERSYGNRLSEYKGQTVEFDPADLKTVRGKELANVESRVIDGTRSTPVGYRLYKTASGWQVYDINIEGASMVRTFYEDFKSTLDNGGYANLLSTLEEKIAKLKAKDDA